MEATKAQQHEADAISGIVVQHLEDGEVSIVKRAELDYPARPQTVLYVSPEPPAVEPPPVEPG